MLNSTNLNDKKYEDLFAEAISMIPVYSREWTNYNVSDPGITVLQNISAFNLLQQTHINEVTDSIRKKLLKLVSFEILENQAAEIFLKAKTPEAIYLPAHKKIIGGGVCFETQRPVDLKDWDISAMYSGCTGTNEDYLDITYLLDGTYPVGTALFGAVPKPGMFVCCILSNLPREKHPVALWIQVYDDGHRNHFDNRFPLQLAKIKWQCYTSAGWKDIVVEDMTNGLLNSGPVWMNLPENEMAHFEGVSQSGYAIRFVIEKSEYDISPRLCSINARLIKASQRETKAACFAFYGGAKIKLDTELAKFGNYFVCCRESSDGPYYAYTPFTVKNTKGRLFKQSQLKDGTVCLHFDKLNFGFGPEKATDAIRVICYDDETIHYSRIGSVFGYENQVIDIDLLTNILYDNFCLMVEETQDNGELTYSFVLPGGENHDELCYELNSELGQICITCPGSKGGCKLYLCDCAVTIGSGGNIRENNQFQTVEDEINNSSLQLTNPSAGFGGYSSETVEQLRKRFVEEIKHPTAAIVSSDYESIVRETPSLCIRKVKAVANPKKNTVKIAVMPYSDELLPKLAITYQDQILRYIEPRRMLTTKIKLVQPKYINIDIKAIIFTKNYHDNSKEEIEKQLCFALDFEKMDSDFGALICYHDILRRLEDLPCVDSVYELILIPRGKTDVTFIGRDILLGDNCLCRPGKLSLELTSHVGTSIQAR